jgi:hypothetical protein
MAVSEITVDDDFEYLREVGNSSIRHARFLLTWSFAGFNLCMFPDKGGSRVQSCLEPACARAIIYHGPGRLGGYQKIYGSSGVVLASFWTFFLRTRSSLKLLWKEASSLLATSETQTSGMHATLEVFSILPRMFAAKGCPRVWSCLEPSDVQLQVRTLIFVWCMIFFCVWPFWWLLWFSIEASQDTVRDVGRIDGSLGFRTGSGVSHNAVCIWRCDKKSCLESACLVDVIDCVLVAVEDLWALAMFL